MDLKDISYALRVAYMAKLKPALKYAGVAVPVYDSIVPNTAPDIFVVLRDQNEADNSAKCSFKSDVHVTTEVVTRFQVGAGSGMIRDNITGQINGLLCSTDHTKRLNLLPDFKLLNSVRTLSKGIEENTSTGVIFRKINIYKHTIQQLT